MTDEGESKMRDIPVYTYGSVTQETIDAALTAIQDVFDVLEFDGDVPELHASIGPVLMNGHPMAALYQANPGEPGRIRVSVSEIMAHTSGDCDSEAIIVSAYVVHESVEHVNHMRGVPLLFAGVPLEKEIHSASETERMANRIAREVTLRRYDVTFTFGDE
jgi:hypothetical protein